MENKCHKFIIIIMENVMKMIKIEAQLKHLSELLNSNQYLQNSPFYHIL